MAGGLVGLLDDVAALAKLAAASVDDVGAAAGRASVKAAGVVVDDTAVTPSYVRGLAAERELPIVKSIALRVAPQQAAVHPPGGVGAQRGRRDPRRGHPHGRRHLPLLRGGAQAPRGPRQGEHHDVPAVAAGPEAEKTVIAGAIRTDFILSAEIMVIALKEVIDEPIVSRAIILAVVALLITVVVYGFVGAIVKMDDVGLSLTQRSSGAAQRAGRVLVTAMPVLLRWLSRIGTAAMLWVGGHILLVGADELGWHGPYDVVHDVEEAVHDTGALSGVLEWLVNTGASALVGLVVGLAVATVVSRIKRSRGSAAHAA
jgi:predicted DNA repair protein MutK